MAKINSCEVEKTRHALPGVQGKLGDKNLRCKSLVINGTKYRTLYNKKFENRRAGSVPDLGAITAVIPGTVLKVFVSQGQAVKKGEEILILEAMKMKNRIKSSRKGVIKKIHVKEGSKVPKNQVLVEMKI